MGAGPCIVDLSASSDEDDDDDLVCLTEFPAHIAFRSSRKPVTVQTCEVSDDLVILDCTDKNFRGPAVEILSQKSSQSSSVVDDDCCILDDDPSKVNFTTACSDNDTEDLVVTGESGPVACRDFPHARHLCVHFPFKTTSHKECCSQCHCYVCDLLAPCLLWGDGLEGGDHCHASDKVGEKWKLLRDKWKQQKPLHQKVPSEVPVCDTSTPATKSDSGIQISSHPPGYENLFARPKDGILSDLSDLFCPDRSTRASNVYGSWGSGNASRGFSQSPPANTVSSLTTSYRGLLGSHPGDSTRPHDPLQISLTCRTRDSSSHARLRHSQDLAMQSRIHKFNRRNVPQLGAFLPFRSERGLGRFPRKLSRSSYSSVFSLNQRLSSSSPCPTQTSQPAVTASPIDANTVAQESLDSHVSSVLDDPLLQDFSSSTAFLASYLDSGTGEQHQQCHVAETISINSSLQFGIADSQLQKVVNSYGTQSNDAAQWSCNSALECDLQLNRGATSDKKLEDSMEPLPSSPPTLLVDYLLDGADFWNDLPGNFD